MCLWRKLLCTLVLKKRGEEFCQRDAIFTWYPLALHFPDWHAWMNNAFGKIEKFVYPSQRAKRHDAPQDYNYGHPDRVSKGKENWEEKQELFGLASFFDSIHLLDHQSIFLSLEWHGLLLHLLQKSCAVAKVLPSCLQSFPLVIFRDRVLAKWLLAVLFMMKTSRQSSHSFSQSQVSNAIQGGYTYSLFFDKKYHFCYLYLPLFEIASHLQCSKKITWASSR